MLKWAKGKNESEHSQEDDEKEEQKELKERDWGVLCPEESHNSFMQKSIDI